MDKAFSKEEYNNEPVLYCKQCLSLRIRDAGLEELIFCDKCGATDIESCHIEEWELAYLRRYGFKYLMQE